MSENELSALLEEIKNYLDITWYDPKEDEKLEGMIKRGMASLSGVLGECNFLEETQEKALLFQMIMYERAGERQQFWANYKSEILSLQMAKKVDEYAKGETETV